MWHDDYDSYYCAEEAGFVAEQFDPDVLARICTLPERKFGRAFGMEKHVVEGEPGPDNFYYYRDNGANVLAVAHLDTVGLPSQRQAHFVDTEAGPVVFSRALDDRLGAYIILDLLPKLSINYDVLLTVGEESGCSTAQFFDAPKQYDWLIEFDRGGTDVVMYQYEDEETRELVRNCGARVGEGIFSDICYLDHLDVKGFNWGVGYRDYHGPKAHAYLNDTFQMVAQYVLFHEQNEGTFMPHYPKYRQSVLSRPLWWEDAASGGTGYDDLAELEELQASAPDESDRWDDDEFDSRFSGAKDEAAG